MPNNIGMGLASQAASSIPGIGSVLGAGIGLGSQVLSWILGSDKTDWDAWKRKQQAGINAQYNESEVKALNQAQKTANATIGETTNAQALASSVSGMSSPGRINAQVYSNIAQNRDRAQTSIVNGLEQNRAAMLSAVERSAAENEARENANAPTAIDYIGNLVNTLQSPVMQEGIGAIIGGIGKGGSFIGNLFKNKKGSIPIVNTNMQRPVIGEEPPPDFGVTPTPSTWPLVDGHNIFKQKPIFNRNGAWWLNTMKGGY